MQQLTQTDMGGNIGTTTFREAGITLQVTPEIGDDTSIRMMVSPEFSALQGYQAGQPIIDRRMASTTVRVMSGDTLVLGGLRRRTELETVQGIPGLMNIKYLGNLFRNHQTQVTESELIIFIQAEIVDVDYDGLLREQVALQVTNETLDHLPTASHAPFIPPCNDPYCPYHNPRPRVWKGSVLAPNEPWTGPGGEYYPPAETYYETVPPGAGQPVPANPADAVAPPVPPPPAAAGPETAPPPAQGLYRPPEVRMDLTARPSGDPRSSLRRLPAVTPTGSETPVRFVKEPRMWGSGQVLR